MDAFKPAKITRGMDEVRETFELWRRQRGKRRAIPEALWDGPVSLYLKHSVHHISLLKLAKKVLAPEDYEIIKAMADTI